MILPDELAEIAERAKVRISAEYAIVKKILLAAAEKGERSVVIASCSANKRVVERLIEEGFTVTYEGYNPKISF